MYRDYSVSNEPCKVIYKAINKLFSTGSIKTHKRAPIIALILKSRGIDGLRKPHRPSAAPSLLNKDVLIRITRARTET